MYCKFEDVLIRVMVEMVLIVAKCIVNTIQTRVTKREIKVLIVAKCIVNLLLQLRTESR